LIDNVKFVFGLFLYSLSSYVPSICSDNSEYVCVEDNVCVTEVYLHVFPSVLPRKLIVS
jgi:hypothetical protein